MAGFSRFNPIALLKRLRATSLSRGTERKTDLTAKHVYQAAQKHRFPTWHQWLRLPSLLSRQERLVAKGALGVGLVSFLLATGLFYTTHLSLVPAPGGEYTEGLVGEPQFINPILAPGSTVDTDMTRLVFRGLFLFDPIEGTIRPDLATSHEVSDDGKTYTIHLRNGATWHDGKPITSNDVVFTFAAIANPDYKSPLALSFRGVTVDIIDESTVVFTLPEAFNGFLSLLDVGILPAHIWEGIAPKRANLANLNLSPVGNGPYQFEKFSKDQNGTIRSYTLTRYKDFYGDRPLIDTLTFKFYPDASSAKDALTNRNIEGLAYLSQEESLAFEESRFVHLLHPTLPQQTVLFFNQTRNSFLKDAHVREALEAVIDRNALMTNAFRGQAQPLLGPLFPETPIDPSTLPTPDITRAIELLDKTSWKMDELSGKRQKPGASSDAEPDVAHIELVTTETADLLAVADALKTAWSPLGIDVTVTSVPQARLHTDVIKPRSYDILLTGILFGADLDPFPFWHSSQTNDPGVNLAGYSNRKVDDAIELARTSPDPEKQKEALATMEKLILADRPAIFLAQPSYTYPIATKLQGVQLNAIIDPSDRFNRVETWFLKTKKAFRWSNP